MKDYFPLKNNKTYGRYRDMPSSAPLNWFPPEQAFSGGGVNWN